MAQGHPGRSDPWLALKRPGEAAARGLPECGEARASQCLNPGTASDHDP